MWQNYERLLATRLLGKFCVNLNWNCLLFYINDNDDDDDGDDDDNNNNNNNINNKKNKIK